MQSKQARKLKSRIDSVNADYVNYTYEKVNYQQKEKLNRKDNDLNAMNMLYTRTMMMLCVEPLRDGIRPSSLLKCFGLYMCCSLLSPNFRNNVDSIVCNRMAPFMEKNASKARPGSKFKKCLDKIAEADAEGNVPCTPESFSVMRIAFAKQAYEDMRQANADTDKIMATYKEAEKCLYQMADDEGISREEFDLATNNMVAGLIRNDNSFRRYFEETAYSKLHVPKDNTLIDDEGGIYNGNVTPRMPESVNAILYQQSNEYYDMIKDIDDPIDVSMTLKSRKARRIMDYYTNMACEDNHIDRRAYNTHKNEYIGMDADTSWMTDFGGEDPFSEDGIDLSFKEYMEQGGPSADPAYHRPDYKAPEIYSAVGRWLVKHPDYSPGEYQRQINDLYYQQVMEIEMAEMFRRRDAVRRKLDTLFNGICGMQDIINRHIDEFDSDDYGDDSPEPEFA